MRFLNRFSQVQPPREVQGSLEGGYIVIFEIEWSQEFIEIIQFRLAGQKYTKQSRRRGWVFVDTRDCFQQVQICAHQKWMKQLK